MANNKTIQVKLQFNADTENAKRQIKQLQQELSNVATKTTKGEQFAGLSQSMEKARHDALELKVALNSATNMETGQINLKKFAQQLAKNGKTIEQYAASMQKLGPEGVKAFGQLSNALSSASTKTNILDGAMKKLGTTFLNTVRWQVSSSVINAVMSSIQGTIDYAKELNESLNNIRIVTGKNTDDMAKFADSANKAAKALNTTTTAYTDASLIYFQQGLSDKQVKQRTETTIKLANVVGENAETVSEWMTAIWNNFDDGSKSLEYYADVLTALGAATASSADEIAGGLEKFAAVAETVGLSYEYAASALATITAETRQSEEVVGTALKTLLSRMEQLKLGEVLDDGTSLGQYSAALATVGVNIKDANGKLKDMDQILSETGAKWETLRKDEQVALAQSVAGIRQYTQFIALMDNWDVMEKNIKISERAAGTLAAQATIYGDSVEAASNRMTAAAEALKRTFVDENDLAPLYDFGAKALDFVTDLTKSIGGLRGILLGLASILAKQLTSSSFSLLNNLQTSIQTMRGWKDLGVTATNLSEEQYRAEQADYQNTYINKSIAKEQAFDLNKEEAIIRNNIAKNAEHITDEERELLELSLQRLKVLKDTAVKQGEIADEAKTTVEANKHDYFESGGLNSISAKLGTDFYNKYVEYGESIGAGKQYLAGVNAQESGITSDGFIDSIRNSTMYQNAESFGIDLEPLNNALDAAGSGTREGAEELGRALKLLIETIEQKQGDFANIDKNGFNKSELYTELEPQVLKEAGLTDKEFETYENYALDNGKMTIDDLEDETKIAELKKEASYIKILTEENESYADAITRVNEKDKNTSTIRAEAIKNSKTYSKVLKDYDDVLELTNEAAQESGSAMVKSSQNAESYKKALAELNGTINKAPNIGDWLSSGLQSMSQALMGVNMLTSGFNALGDAIARGEDDFSSWVTGLSSIAMGAISLMGSLAPVVEVIKRSNDAKAAALAKDKLLQKSQEENIVGNVAEAGSEKLKAEVTERESKKTIAAKLAEAKAKIASWFGSGPWGWVIAAASIAAIAGLGIHIAAQASKKKIAKEEEEQDRVNQVEKAKTQIDTSVEEYEATENLLDSYHDLSQTYLEVGSGLDKLIEKATELNKVWNDQHLAMAILSGDYDTINKRITELTKEKTAEQASEANVGLKSLWKDETKRSLKSGRGFEIGEKIDAGQRKNLANYMSSQGKLAFNEHGTLSDDAKEIGYLAEFDLGKDDSDEAGIIKAIEEVEGAKDYLNYDAIQNKVFLAISKKDWEENPHKVVEAFDLMGKVVTKALEEQPNADEISEGWKKMSDWINQKKEAVNGLSDKLSSTASIRADNLLYKEEEKFGIDLGATGLTEKSYKAYEAAFKAANGEEEVEQAILNNISQRNATLAMQIQTITTIMEQFGKNADEARAIITGMSETELRALQSVLSQNDGLYNDIDAALKEAKVQEDKIAKTMAQQAFTDAKYSGDIADQYVAFLEDSNDIFAEIPGLAEGVAKTIVEAVAAHKEFQKTWGESVAALVEEDSNSIEYSAALVNTADGLQKLYGVSLEGYDNVVREFIAHNTERLGRLAQGDFSEYTAIGKELAREMAKAVSDGAYSENFEELFADLDKADKTLQVGEEIKFDKNHPLNKALENSDLAPEQVREIFEAYGFGDVEFDGQTVVSARKIDLQTYLDSAIDIDDSKLERYHEIKEILSDINDQMGRISDAKDRAFGGAKLGYIEKEIELQKELVEQQKEYVNQIEADISKDAAKLSGLGVDLDEKGRIKNYTEILKNNPAAKEAMDQYEKTLNLYESEYTKYLQEQYKLTDRHLEQISTEVEKVTSKTERDLKLIEFQLEHITDKALDAAKAFGLINKKVSGAEKDLKANDDAIRNILKDNQELLELSNLDLAEKSTDELIKQITENGNIAKLDGKAIEDLQKYSEAQVDAYGRMVEGLSEMRETVVESFDTWNEKIEHNIKLIEHQQQVLENYENIADLLGDHASSLTDEIMGDLVAAQTKAAQVQVASTKTAYETAKAMYDKTKKMYDSANESNKKAATEGQSHKIETIVTEEQLHEMEAEVNAKQLEFMESWSAALEAAANEFDKSVERILKHYDDAMGKLEKKADLFEKTKTLNDFYLKDYEKTYEINKLSRQINQSLDKSMNMSLRNKSKLAALDAEILAYQAEGKQMSDYDLGYLQKKYDLTLAQIALEEAQNAKSQVRLTRDSQGNYGYVYTADQSAIDNAQQNYEDKAYALEKFMEDSTNELSSMSLQLQQEWADALAALDKNSKTYAEDAKKINDHYVSMLTYTMGEAEELVGRGTTLVQDFNLKVATDFSDTLMGKIYPEVDSFGQLCSRATTEMGTTVTNLVSAYESYATTLSETMTEAGTTLEGFSQQVQTAVNGNEKEKGALEIIGELKGKISTLGAEATNNFGAFVTNAHDELAKLNFEEAHKKIEALLSAINTAMTAYEELAEVKDVTPPKPKYTGNIDYGKVLDAIYHSHNNDMIRAQVEQDRSEMMSATDYSDTYYEYGAREAQDLNKEERDYLAELEKNHFSESYIDKEEKVPDVNTTPPETPPKTTTRLEDQGWIYATNNALVDLYGDGKPEYYRYGNQYAKITDYKKQGNSQYVKFDKEKLEDILLTRDSQFEVPAQQQMWIPSNEKTIIFNGQEFWRDSNGKYWKKDDFVEISTDQVDGYKTYVLKGDIAKPTRYMQIFDTGGYTGAWGPEGRLAMLHQKEIVLNAHDTENLLSAVQMIRSIVEKVELNAIAQRYTNLLTSEYNRAIQQIAPAGTLDQNVHIDAHFPNATDHSQIEEAFGNIVNLAAQYANRK